MVLIIMMMMMKEEDNEYDMLKEAEELLVEASIIPFFIRGASKESRLYLALI